MKDISLYAKPGQKIAFVGSTGAGKTTITNLLNRFYDVQKGAVMYDGLDIRDICKDSLRRSLGMVLQLSLIHISRGRESLCLAAGAPFGTYLRKTENGME